MYGFPALFFKLLFVALYSNYLEQYLQHFVITSAREILTILVKLQFENLTI